MVDEVDGVGVERVEGRNGGERSGQVVGEGGGDVVWE